MNCKRFLLALCLALLLVVPGWIVAGGEYEPFEGKPAEEIDISGVTWYFLYVTTYDAWCMKAMAVSGTTTQFRTSWSYVSGDIDYATAWTNRAATAGASAFQVKATAFD